MIYSYIVKLLKLILIALSFTAICHASDIKNISPSIKDCQGYGDSLVESSGSSLAEIGESPVDIRRTVDYYCMLGYLASSGGQPQIQNSTHINTVNVNSNPTTVDALTKSINQQASRASTNAAFSSSVR